MTQDNTFSSNITSADKAGITPAHINDMLIQRHGADLHRKFQSAHIAICGLGGLGSAIAIALARAGVGKLHLIDYDKVDLSNIHRQQYDLSQIGLTKTEALKMNIERISPCTQIITDTTYITDENLTELLKDATIVCEAFDRAEAKAMLVNGVLEHFPDKYIVSGSGMAGISSANTIHTRRVTKHFYLCGDETSDIDDGLGLISSRVLVCAAHQANMILRILAEEYEA